VNDYYGIERVRYKETQALVQNLYHYLITLATSLKGQLSSNEEDTLAKLFQVQMDLQMLLDEISLRASAASLSASPENQTSNIAHAQAIQYARDLIIAMRQKREQQHRLELTSQQLIRAEKLATVGHVAATVAHELGNIFTPLLMYAKLIYKETVGDEKSEVAEYATQITEIANRASDMLRQLVDASRSEPAKMVPLDLTSVIKNALTLFKPRIKKQDLRVEQHYPENLPMVTGRPDQLEQVFINLALNAFDAKPNGGNLTITLEASGNEKLDARARPDFVTVYVKDTGIGIPPENISLLFEPFYTTKAQGAGSGLGLFVTHLIIDQHGGAIEVDSEIGMGTTFTIKLPAVSKQENVNDD
jgi:two-component system NtrC family sensor kinase